MGGLTLPTSLRQQARADAASRPKSLIYIVPSGGPSMWDPKPDATVQYRGPLNAIATRPPGVHLSDLLGRQAAMMDQLARLRGIRSVENDFLSEVYTCPAAPAVGPRLAPSSAVWRACPVPSHEDFNGSAIRSSKAWTPAGPDRTYLGEDSPLRRASQAKHSGCRHCVPPGHERERRLQAAQIGRHPSQGSSAEAATST
jgi:hypothetical protein